MRGSSFPIAEVKNNELISIDGDLSYFFKVIPPDLEQFTDHEITSFYNGVSSGLNQLDSEDFFKFYFIGGKSYLNTNKKEIDLRGPKMAPQKKPLETFFRDKDFYSNLKFYDDYLSYNGQYLRILSVVELSGEEINQNFLPNDVDYVLSFKRIKKEKSLMELERIRTAHSSSFFKNKRDISSEGAYEQAEELIADLTYENESLFKMELFFIIRGHSLDELKDNTDDLITFMQKGGTKLFIEGHSLKKLKSGLGEIFKELIVGVRPSLNLRDHTNKTSHLRYLLPFFHSSLMKEGIRFFDLYDNPIYLHPFSKNEGLISKNMLVSGTTGAGKSVVVNTIVHSLIDKHPTVILDQGGSFRRLTLYHDGHHLEKGLNPMHFKCPTYLKEMILSMVDEKEFSKLETGRLLKSIKEILEKDKDIYFKNLIYKLEPNFSGLPYYFEEFFDFINDDEFKEVPILYTDIEEYSKELVTPIIIYLLEYFKSIRINEKILVFDECWQYLKTHASYIENCWKTYRKKGNFPIGISQALAEFSRISNGLCDSLTNTSHLNMIFPQEIREDSILDSFDKSRVDSLEFRKNVFSEFYFKTKDNKFRKVVRNYLSPLQFELFHTENGEDAPFWKFFNDNRIYFDSNKETIHAFVRLKYGIENIHDPFYFANNQSKSEHLLFS